MATTARLMWMKVVYLLLRKVRFTSYSDSDFNKLYEGESLDLSFEYTVRDSKGTESSAVATITVTGTGQKANLQNDSFTFSASKTGYASTTLLDNDTGDSLKSREVDGQSLSKHSSSHGYYGTFNVDEGRVFITEKGKVYLYSDSDFLISCMKVKAQTLAEYTVRDSKRHGDNSDCYDHGRRDESTHQLYRRHLLPRCECGRYRQ